LITSKDSALALVGAPMRQNAVVPPNNATAAPENRKLRLFMAFSSDYRFSGSASHGQINSD
jgi:hypothetical protein